MSSPEDEAGSSKRRRLNVKAEKVDASRAAAVPSTLTATFARDPLSTIQPSPAPASNGRVRDRSASQLNGYEQPYDDEAGPLAKGPKKEEPVELDLDGVVQREAAGAEDDSDADPDASIDDGDGLMADLSAEARERLAMRDADGCVVRS